MPASFSLARRPSWIFDPPPSGPLFSVGVFSFIFSSLYPLIPLDFFSNIFPPSFFILDFSLSFLFFLSFFLSDLSYYSVSLSICVDLCQFSASSSVGIFPSIFLALFRTNIITIMIISMIIIIDWLSGRGNFAVLFLMLIFSNDFQTNFPLDFGSDI